MSGFRIYLNGTYYDEVFSSRRMTCDEVKKSFEQNGLKGNIVVKPFRI